MDGGKLKEYCKNNYKLKYNEDLNTINLELKEDSNKSFMTLLPCISNPTNLEKLIGNEFEVCLENNSNYSKIKCDEYKESKMTSDDILLNNNIDINEFKNATNVNDYNDADSKKQMIILNSDFNINKPISFPFDSISQYISDYNMITSGKIDTEIIDVDTKEFEDLKKKVYWVESKNPIDITTEKGKDDLHDIMKYKLPENHRILRLLNKLDYTQSDMQIILKNIRDNTKEYIGTNDIIPKGFESKLLLLEIQLYLYQLDEDTSINDSLISDINFNPVYPSQIQSITRQYNSNIDFQKCIQTEFSSINKDIENIKNYTNKSSKVDFDTYLDSLVVVLKRIKEMSPYTIYNCMEIVLEVDDICKGDMIKEYIQLLQLLFTYTNINISIDENPDDYSKMINKTYPLMKDIYKNLIEYTKSHPQCVGNSNDVVESYDKIYEKLFSKEKPTINYNLFSNISISDFFSDFTKNIYGKIILLVFFVFIFVQIVKLFTIQPQVPTK